MAKKTKTSGNKMWGGRFASAPDAIMQKINASIDFDWHLYRQDIAASKAHAEMLAKQGIIGADDARKIIHGLDTILSEIGSGKFKFKRELEDIHMHVESALIQRIGDVGRKLHTARSRNDQVATDLKLYVSDSLTRLDELLHEILAEVVVDHVAAIRVEEARLLLGHRRGHHRMPRHPCNGLLAGEDAVEILARRFVAGIGQPIRQRAHARVRLRFRRIESGQRKQDVALEGRTLVS